jgi:hypothetical protein
MTPAWLLKDLFDKSHAMYYFSHYEYLLQVVNII